MSIFPTDEAIWAEVDRHAELAGVSTRSTSPLARRLRRGGRRMSLVSALADRLTRRDRSSRRRSASLTAQCATC